jgi:hypothetical protein
MKEGARMKPPNKNMNRRVQELRTDAPPEPQKHPYIDILTFMTTAKVIKMHR